MAYKEPKVRPKRHGELPATPPDGAFARRFLRALAKKINISHSNLYALLKD
jgi:hypothetical protein